MTGTELEVNAYRIEGTVWSKKTCTGPEQTEKITLSILKGPCIVGRFNFEPVLTLLLCPQPFQEFGAFGNQNGRRRAKVTPKTRLSIPWNPESFVIKQLLEPLLITDETDVSYDLGIWRIEMDKMGPKWPKHMHYKYPKGLRVVFLEQIICDSFL